MTPDVDDLRLAMREATDLLTPRVTYAEVRARAMRSRLRRGIAGFFAVLSSLGVGLLVTGLLATGTPTPRPTPALSLDATFRPVGDVIFTGVRVGTAYDLILYFPTPEMPQLSGGLRDRQTGAVRLLSPGGGEFSRLGFGAVGQLDDRNGGIIDYGMYIGDVHRITVEADNRTTQARVAAWRFRPAWKAFWVRRTGQPVGPSTIEPADPFATARPTTPGPTDSAVQPSFKAYSRDGALLDTSRGPTERTDLWLLADDMPRIGDVIRTGLRTPNGRERVIWFKGDTSFALMEIGERDWTTGDLTRTDGWYALRRPPYGNGFYPGVKHVAGDDGTYMVIFLFVGPAARIDIRHRTSSVTTGSSTWNLHPELTIAWATGLRRTDVFPTAEAYDADGRLLATWSR